MDNYPLINRNKEFSIGKMYFFRFFPLAIAHQHAYFELVYVVQGSAIRKTAQSETVVTAGDYYLNSPFDIHSYEKMENFEVISILFQEEDVRNAFLDASTVSSLLSNKLDDFGLPEHKSLNNLIFHDSDGTVRQLMRKMEQEFTSCRICYAELFRFYLALVLVHASRACQTRTPNSAVMQILDFLKLHYAEKISLDSLSQLVGYSPQYLSYMFSKEVNMNIQTFLQHIRIERACELLSRTDTSVTEIAAQVGYPDPKHFSQIFRRYTNVSPKEYRKKHKQ